MELRLNSLLARLLIGSAIPLVLFIGVAALASFGGAVVLAIVLTVILAFHSARGVTRPLEALREAAGQLMAGRFRTVAPSGPTEIVDLIIHFNHMAITLSERAGELKGQEERYRTYIGAVSHILWTTNAAGEVVNDLPTWRAFTGQSEGSLRGLGWLDAVHPDDRPAVTEAWRRAVETRGAYDLEYRMQSCQGDYRHFACRGVPIVTDGVVREWIGTCTDITDRKTEAALRQAKEAAEANSRAKSDFLAKMSHELRTPLNAVIGMSKMLSIRRFGPLTDKQADYLKDINQAGAHLLALINDILDLAKIEAGRLETQTETFLVVETMGQLLSTMRSLADTKGVALQFLPPASDGDFHADLGRFRQILHNLLSNAIKFTPAGKSVTIQCQWLDRPACAGVETTERQATAVRIIVRDTGIGIAREDQEAIWEEFRQFRTSADDGQQGTGLGLALTRHLVQLLGGDIGLESAFGEGSTFWFVIPRNLSASPEWDGEISQPRRASA